MRQFFRLPNIFLWLAPLLLMAPVFLTGRALFWGTPALQFVPWWQWAYEALQAGRLPLWNPQIGMGAPLAANYQSAIFYPFTWIYFALAAIGGTTLMSWGQSVLVALHLAVAGFGMARLARSLGLQVLPQVVAGLAYGLSGYLVARAGFLSINAAAAWLPWVLWAARRLVTQPRLVKGALWLALFLGLQLLAGHAQTAAYTIAFAFVWTGFCALQDRRRDPPSPTTDAPPWAVLSRAYGWFAVGVASAIGLAAVQLVLTAEYLLQSQRAAAVEYGFAITYSFWPWRMLGFVAPDLFGNPARGDYWGYANYWEDAVYIGLLPFLMALGVIFSHRSWRLSKPAIENPGGGAARRHGWLVRFLTAVTLVSLVLALGSNTPVFPWLYTHVPGFDMFQAPTRISLLAVFSLSLLAGVGVANWRRPEGRSLYWTRLGTAAAVAVCLGAGAAWQILSGVQATFLRASALAGFWGIGLGVLSLSAPPKGAGETSGLWSWAVGAFLAADLLVAGWGLNPAVDLEFYGNPAPTAPLIKGLAADGRLYLAPDEEYTLKFERFLRFDSFNPGEDWSNLRAALLPNLHLLDGLAHSANFDPLVPGRYARWMEKLGGLSGTERLRLLNLMAVTVVERGGLLEPFRVDFVALEPHPRIWWTGCARFADGEEQAWDMVMGGDVDLQKEIILEQSGGISPQDCVPGPPARLRVGLDDPHRQEVEISTEVPGWLFVADTWYPGWEATIDGMRVPLMRADYLFRAVEVPAGSHLVAFHYRPRAFSIAVVVSIVSWIALVGGYAAKRS